MRHTITELVSIHPLNTKLWKCAKRDATYQLEIYHTNESPEKNVGAISEYNGNFSYNIGTMVDVKPRVDLNLGLWLTNCIMNDCLRNYVQRGY